MIEKEVAERFIQVMDKVLEDFSSREKVDVKKKERIALRDYFAAQALPILYKEYDSYVDLASEAYKVANAMLTEREYHR